jgi:hypothetical protein
MKKRSRGCPSSDNRNSGFENEVSSWMRRAEAVTPMFVKAGAALESAIIRAGYREDKLPEVVATMA